MTMNEKILAVAQLTALASNKEAWLKQYGKKTLAEVMASFLSCEELCSNGVDVDYAVELKGTSRFCRGAQLKHSGGRKNGAVSEIAEEKAPKMVVLNKKNGKKITLKKRGDKMVIKGGKEKPTTANTRFIKSKSCANTKMHKVYKIASNGDKLTLIYMGDELVQMLRSTI